MLWREQWTVLQSRVWHASRAPTAVGPIALTNGSSVAAADSSVSHRLLMLRSSCGEGTGVQAVSIQAYLSFIGPLWKQILRVNGNEASKRLVCSIQNTHLKTSFHHFARCQLVQKVVQKIFNSGSFLLRLQSDPRRYKVANICYHDRGQTQESTGQRSPCTLS